MAVEIPSTFKFEHLLSHTFPGFFSALTLFMILDIWSPINLTSQLKDLTGLISFVGLILLIGSILGIIIDGIHHSIIEDLIFDNFSGIEKIKEIKEACLKESLKKYTDGDAERLSRHFFLKKMNGKDIHQYLVEEFYCYSEFYSNTFISLIPFSLVIPFYLIKNLEISWGLSISIAFACFVFACISFNSSYAAYLRYNKAMYSAICGYLEG